ncbi:hypothetical protein SAMN05216249_101190 [Acetitomaculum ruminis DSM 5522]|uniref:LysM domain-containing protein n=1 Tax=Acetitomaculum ruminis DSM 5522 TaxID=1120918 RepID=A0A1I0V6M8_9FIRM|nr:hypothetical protein [Acetitomaculum ruminis]SFA71938.1 hypothetical protein SAMN05216249_101190 [Acetitomaculum ruminis DSM 5522]
MKEIKLKRTIYVTICLICCCIILLFFCNSKFKDGNLQGQAVKYYKTIQIHNNDSLWSIACQYAPDGNYEAYIEEVSTINHLSTDVLYIGCYLTIPVYNN